jgi:hypothetical protein
MEDNIKMHLQEVGWGGVDRITLAQVAVSCECGDEPSGSIKCREFLDCPRTCLFLKEDCCVELICSLVTFSYT